MSVWRPGSRELLAASNTVLTRSSAGRGISGHENGCFYDDVANSGAREHPGSALPQTAPSVPAAEPASLLVGFDLSGAAENSVAEVGHFTNLAVIGDWMTKAGRTDCLPRELRA